MEDVPKVPSAFRTHDLDALHAVRLVHFDGHGVGVALVEGWPAWWEHCGHRRQPQGWTGLRCSGWKRDMSPHPLSNFAPVLYLYVRRWRCGGGKAAGWGWRW